MEVRVREGFVESWALRNSVSRGRAFSIRRSRREKQGLADLSLGERLLKVGKAGEAVIGGAGFT